MERTIEAATDAFWRAAGWFWLACCVLFFAAFCSRAFSAPPRVLYILDNGYRTLAIDEAGEPINVPFDTVLDFRTGTPDDPSPPTDPDEPDEPPPQPDIDKELAAKVQAWAKEIDDPMGAQAISWAYTRVRGDLDEGLLSPHTIWPTLAAHTRTALKGLKEPKDWQPFANKVEAELNDRIADLQTVKAVRRMLSTIQWGIDHSYSGDDVQDIDLHTLDQIGRAFDR